jgi:prolyl-tRNA synthetase
MATVDTPGVHTMEDLTRSLDVPIERCLKTLLVEGADGGLVALVLRGDHQLNAIKAEGLEAVADPLTMASDARIREVAGCGAGSLGPVGLDMPVIADHAALPLADFVCGANQEEKHLTGVNWGRDLVEPQAGDLRDVVAGDIAPDGGRLDILRGIEVGHIFQLGQKYSAAMGAEVLDEDGKPVTLYMGCYGIGVTRLVAAAIEQGHDDRGIIWPAAIAPFELAIVPINLHKSHRLREAVDALYAELEAAGISVLLDDRETRPGVKFADMDLIGIPHRIVLSDKGLDAGTAEYKPRAAAEPDNIPLDGLTNFLAERIVAEKQA